MRGHRKIRREVVVMERDFHEVDESSNESKRTCRRMGEMVVH